MGREEKMMLFRAILLSLYPGQIIEVPFFLGENGVPIFASSYTYRRTALTKLTHTSDPAGL
jgi:hypothetical protein